MIEKMVEVGSRNQSERDCRFFARDPLAEYQRVILSQSYLSV